MAIERTGVVAVFDMSDFDRGLGAYVNGVMTANTASDRLSAGMTASGQSMSATARVTATVGGAFANAASIISRFLSFLGQLIKIAAMAAAGITVLAFAIGKLDSLFLFIASATSKIPILSNLFKQLAKDYQAVGGSAGATDALSARVGSFAGLGLKVVSLVAAFNALKGVLGLTKPPADNAAKGLTAMASAAVNVHAPVSGLGNIISVALGSALGTMTGNLIPAAINAFMRLGTTVMNTLKAFAEGAPRITELNSVLGMLGAKQGITTDEIDKSTTAIRALGIEYGVAQNAVMQSIRYNISLKDTESLANVARNAGVIGMSNTSEALDRINWAVQTNQMEILRGIGINVQMDTALGDYARTVRKSANDLSSQERMQAIVNAVIKEGIKIDGAYVTAQKEAGKELRSFDRYLDDIKIGMGAPFQGAFANAVFSISGLLKTLGTLVTTAGPVQDALYNIGAMASIITQPFLDFSNMIVNKFKPAAVDSMAAVEGSVEQHLQGMSGAAISQGAQFLRNLSNTLSGAAENALRYGVNIVTQLATGMAQGAAAALTAAMDAISGMLNYWLAPGSPPRVAPLIDQQGAAAMAAWLHGMTEADFSILDAIQGPLKSVLDVVGRNIDFAPLSAGLMSAISDFSKTGVMNSDILTRLSDIGGVYGKELSDLAKLQFDLARATNEVNDADKRLVAAQTNVGTLTAEYNTMLRSGAGKEALKNKLLEINAASKAGEQAAKDKIAATTKVSSLKEQASLQSNVLSQLLEVERANQAALKAAQEKADLDKKAGKGEKLPELQLTVGAIDFKKPIDKALDVAKAAISAKLKDIFKPLQTAWTNTIYPTLTELATRFEGFKNTLLLAWNAIAKAVNPVIDAIKKVIPTDVLQRIGQAVGAFVAVYVVLGVLGGVFTAVAGVIGTAVGLILSGPGLLIAAIVLLKIAWDKNLFGIRDTLTKVWTTNIKPVLDAIIASVGRIIDAFKTGGIQGAISAVFGEMLKSATNALQPITNMFKPAIAVIAGTFKLVKSVYDNTVGIVLNRMYDLLTKYTIPAWKSVGSVISNIVGGLVTWLRNMWDAAAPLRELWASLGNIFAGVGGTVGGSVLPMFQAIGNFITDIVMPAIGSLINTGFNVLESVMKTGANTWNNIVLPALNAVWSFISVNILPIFTALATLITAVVVKAWEVLVALFNKFILPGLREIWNFLETNTLPTLRMLGYIVEYYVGKAFQGLSDVWTKSVAPALTAFWDMLVKNLNPTLQWLHDNLLVPIEGVFNRIPAAIQSVTKWIGDLATSITNMKLPAWLQPGSPTPLEDGLVGVGEAARQAAIGLYGEGGSLGSALYMVSEELGTRLLPWMGEEEGLVYTLNLLKLIASGSSNSIAAPLAETFLSIKGMAAEAAVSVLSVADGMKDIAALNGTVSIMTVIIHEITIREDRQAGHGAVPSGGKGGGGYEAYGHGGWTPTGPIRTELGEFVLNQQMRAGKQTIPANVLSSAAKTRLVSNNTSTITTNEIAVNFNDVKISDNMDLATIDNRVRRVVRDQLRRR